MGLTAQIQTKYGPTRKITIRDNIQQGGVPSVIEYATLMDEITKEINKNDIGLELRNGETCYGWIMSPGYMKTLRKHRKC